MAYFSNSTEGQVFEQQCAKCKYGEDSCPIALVQMTYNYEAVGNETVTKILNTLVSKAGVCQMRETFKKDLASDGSKQQKLF